MTDLLQFRVTFKDGSSTRLHMLSEDDPHADDKITVSEFSFTNHAIGGFGRATIKLLAQNATFLRETLPTMKPDTQVRIDMRCTGEPSVLTRYVGIVTEIDMGGGTDPHQATVQCRGASAFLRQIPLFIATDNLSINANVKLVNDFLDTRHLVEGGEEADITAGTEYDIRRVDFLDTAADRALQLLAKVAGPNTLYGFCTPVDGVIAHGRLYFKARSSTVLVMPEYSIGNGVTEADARWTKDRCVNGVLIRCQRKLGGGDLTLWVSPMPPPFHVPWRIAKLRMSETLDPAEAWEYASAHRNEQTGVHRSVTYQYTNLGRQIWTDEILDTKVRVYLTEDQQVYEDVYIDSATVRVVGTGSVTTSLRLGEDRKAEVAEFLGELYHDVQVGDSSEFWTAAELAAQDSDAVRDWRHHAAATNKMRNLWHAPIAGLEAILTSEDAGLLGLDNPFLTSYADWVWDGDTNGVMGDGDKTVIYSVFVPTGRRAVSATVYAELSELWYKASQVSMWNAYAVGDGFQEWDTSGSIKPKLHASTATYAAEAHLLRELDANLENSPITIDVDRPKRVAGTIVAPTSAGQLAALDHFTDVFTAMQRHGYGDPSEPLIKYYGLRMVAIDDGGAGLNVYCLLGWGHSTNGLGVNELVFHQGYFDGAIPPMAPFFVSSDEDSDYYCPFLRMVFTLPAEDNNWYDYGVSILNGDSGDVLLERSGHVDPFGTGLWHPGAVYGGGWDQRRPYAAGMWWENYPVGAVGYIPRPSPHGIRKVKLSSSSLDAVNCGATRDGVAWGHGVTGQKFDLGGENTWQGGDDDGQYGVRVSIELPKTISMTRLGVGFKHDGEIT